MKKKKKNYYALHQRTYDYGELLELQEQYKAVLDKLVETQGTKEHIIWVKAERKLNGENLKMFRYFDTTGGRDEYRDQFFKANPEQRTKYEMQRDLEYQAWVRSRRGSGAYSGRPSE